MRPSHRPAATAAAALLLAGGLAGCSMFGDSGGGSGGAAEGSVGKASIDNDTKPIVKGTFDSPISQGAKVDIAVMSLRQRDKLATLTVHLTPHIPAGGDQNPNPYNLNGGNGLDVSLIDAVNLKRYVTVKDSAGVSLQTDEISTHVANNQTGTFTWTFAAPPKDVKALDVRIGAWPMFRGIPVQR